MKPIIVLALLTAACLIGDSMLYVVLPTHWEEAGLNSLWEVGVLLSANRLVRLPLNPLVGWLYKKISTRQGVFFAVILAAATTFSYGLVKGFLPLLLIRCLWGLAWTFLRLGSYFAIIDCSTDSNRGHCMGTFNGLYRLGSLAGMLAGGFIADFYGLSVTSLLFGAITLLSIPAVLLWVPSSKGKNTSAEEQPSSKSVLWKDSTILWALLTGTLVAMIYQGVFNATLSYLVQVHNSSTINIYGIAIGAASLAGILQAMRWGWEPWLAPWVGKKSDGKYGRRRVLIISLLLAGFLFALIPLSIPLLPWLLIVIGIQLTATALTTITDAIASDAASRSSKYLVLTAYSVAIDFGAAIGPFIGYLLNGYVEAYAAYWGTAVILLLLTTAWLIPNKTTTLHIHPKA
ncbi:MAG: MFS transporter [Veillonellales bacterium]